MTSDLRQQHQDQDHEDDDYQDALETHGLPFPCWLAKYASTPCDFASRYRPDPAHLIPQRVIRDRLRSWEWTPRGIELALSDHRIVVPACRRHHHAFDVAKTIRLKRADYPDDVWRFADDYHLDYDESRAAWRPSTPAGTPGR